MTQITVDSTIKLTIPKFLTIVGGIIALTFSATIVYSKLTQTSAEFEKTKSEVAEMQSAISKISSVLDLMQKEQSNIKTEVSVTKESLNTLRNEAVVTSSYIKELDRKRKL